ncbi:MAG: hypothetical protein NW217_14740 [Hyphomicrobiaceae bacterium]|nr:hypothetical protein [Hyphomicrobiaceae bacterium]
MNLTRDSILFNAAAGLCVLGAAGYIAADALMTPSNPTCTASYPPANVLPLENSYGEPMSPVELLTSIGGMQRGVLEHARASAVDGAPSPLVIQVGIKAGTSSSYQSEKDPGGVSFAWRPEAMAGASAACLSYSVRMAEGFEFGMGGLLPGLYGGRILSINERSDGKSGLAARIAWRKDGAGAVFVQFPKATGANGIYQPATGFAFAPGRWVRVDQEVVLNEPGAANGSLRVWFDGELVVDRKGIVWREDASLELSGVVADVSYGGSDRNWTAPKDGQIDLTPLELSWR